MDESKIKKSAIKSSWPSLALLATLWVAPAHAADKPPPAQGTIGTGTFSCAKFGKYDTMPNNGTQMNMLVQWIWGFMSAYNARAAFAETFQEADAPNPVAPPDPASILQFVRTHCEKKPQSNVANATLDLITTLGGTVTSSIAFPASAG